MGANLNIPLLLARALASASNEGLLATARKFPRHLLHRSATHPFDLAHGTDTSGVVPAWRLRTRSANAAHAVQYEATDPDEIRQAVAFAGLDPPALTFIDLGCGKGRAVIVAAQLGFKCIVGVEFASQLIDIARANVAKLGVTNVALHLGDAGEYRFAAKDFVLFLFNPFSRTVAEAVLGNMALVAEHVRCVIYKRPNCADLLDGWSTLERLGSPPGNPDVLVWIQRAAAPPQSARA